MTSIAAVLTTEKKLGNHFLLWMWDRVRVKPHPALPPRAAAK
jgi:hypothetical protein